MHRHRSKRRPTSLLTIINDILDFSKIEAGSSISTDPMPTGQLRREVGAIAWFPRAAKNSSLCPSTIRNVPTRVRGDHSGSANA